MLFCWFGGSYCHANAGSLSLWGRFNAVLCFCVWFGVLCLAFAVLLFLGSLFGKLFGSELLFLGVSVGLVLFGGVLPRLLLYDLALRPRNFCKKVSSRQVFGFGSFSPS